MKNKELFDKTVGFLVKAYQTDTLTYAECAACAVGNIIAGNLGINLHIEYDQYGTSRVLDKDDKNIRYNAIGGTFNTNPALWVSAISTGTGRVLKRGITDEILKQAALTGYSLEELAKIERAFFLGTRDKFDNEENTDNFRGLMKVVDCLMKIHEANIKEVKEAKKLFVKA